MLRDRPLIITMGNERLAPQTTQAAYSALEYKNNGCIKPVISIR